MEIEGLFQQASRSKFRFATAYGLIMLEDLWDLPLSSDTRKANLDDIAKELNRQLKNADEQSFVKPTTVTTNEIQAKFDLVLHVIKVKMEERDARKALADKEATKQKIMAILDIKQQESLLAKSPEELKALLNSM